MVGGHLLRPSTATELARRARGFDVITVAASGSTTLEARALVGPTSQRLATPVRWSRYGWAVALVSCLYLALAFVMYPHVDIVNLLMVYLLGVTIAGLRLGRGPSVLTSVLSVASFDFFFVPPRFSFAVSDAQYLITFAVMLLISLVIATLMASVRQQTRVSGARERRTALLYAMSRELAATRGTANMCAVAVRHVAEVFQCKVVVLLPDGNGRLHYPIGKPNEAALRGADLAVAQWVADHGRQAGLGTDTLPAAAALYVPLGDARSAAGRTGGAAGESTASDAARAAAPAGDLCRTDRPRAGTSVARRAGREPRAYRPKGKVCATRCWPQFRMICARRWR